MKALGQYSPYGWKAKIGLIIPSTNTSNEPEFYRMAPPGVTIHTSRLLLVGETTQESYQRMAAALEGASEALATAEVDVIAYSCTSGSIMCPLPQLLKTITDKTATPATAASGAVVAALRALGVQRVAVATPYPDLVNDRQKKFLEDYGFRVSHLQGLDLGHTQEERRAINRIPPEAVFRLARAVDRPDAQAVFISCTAVATIDVIAELEKELGKPVISSNTAVFWSCLRLLGLRIAIPGYGRLLEQCLDPIDAGDFGVAAPRRLQA
jgi:maleate cis-trans isomerase